MIDRSILTELHSALDSYPIVVLTGARQTGKTTLARLMKDKPYYNLENPDVRELIKTDARFFLKKTEETGAVIDEFQRVPELASYLQVIVDEKKQNGMYLLTGSNNFLMMENVSQSMAGRAAILKLPPLSLKEMADHGFRLSTDDFLYHGFYPAIHANNLNPTKTYEYYYQTYLERDVRQLINIKDLSIFQRFIRLCAGRAGQLLNFEQLANDTGTSAKTIRSWLSVLEASYIIFLLPPYFGNINKRIVKAQKLYFFDVGLAAYLLGIESKSHIATHPLRGPLFENMIVAEYLKTRFNKGRSSNAFYYLDNHRKEVDLMLIEGNNATLIEIKSAATYHTSFSSNLDWLEKVLSLSVIKKVVLYDGDQTWEHDKLLITNFRNFFIKKD